MTNFYVGNDYILRSMTSFYVGNDYILKYVGNDYISRPNDKFLHQ